MIYFQRKVFKKKVGNIINNAVKKRGRLVCFNIESVSEMSMRERIKKNKPKPIR